MENANEVCFLARSVYHGPAKSGLMEIKPVDDDYPKLSHTQTVFALHGPNLSSDFAMLGTQ